MAAVHAADVGLCTAAAESPQRPQAAEAAAASTLEGLEAGHLPASEAWKDVSASSATTSAAEVDASKESSKAEVFEDLKPQTAKQRCLASVSPAFSSAAAGLGSWMYPGSSSSGAQTAPRLDALDAPRWIASIQIVTYHMYKDWEPIKAYAGWFGMWTQLFFVLSGFVLTYAELAKPPKVGSARPSWLRYVRRRLTVIYPAFFLSLLLKVSIRPAKSAWEWSMLPLHALLLQSWFPICDTSATGWVRCSAWLYNGEAWFLSVLVLYWLSLRPLAEFFRRRTLEFSSCALVACWLFSFVPQFLGSESRLANMMGCEDDKQCKFAIMVGIRAGPLGYFHVFIAGVAAARVFMLLAMRDADTGCRIDLQTKSIRLAVERAPVLLRFGCCIGYLAYAMVVLLATDTIKSHYYFFHNGGMLPVMLLILLGAAVGRDPLAVWVFRSKPMLVLGRISYLQYLMQHVLQGWINTNFGWEDNETARALFLPALIIFSYCCQRWVEGSCTEYQRLRQEKRLKGCDDWAIESLERAGAWAKGLLLAVVKR